MNILTIKRTKNEYILMNLINGMLRITSNMFNLMIGFEEIYSEDLTETWLRRDLLMGSRIRWSSYIPCNRCALLPIGITLTNKKQRIRCT